MKKQYITPVFLFESFIAESYCTDVSGGMPAGSGDNNVPIGDL